MHAKAVYGAKTTVWRAPFAEDIILIAAVVYGERTDNVRVLCKKEKVALFDVCAEDLAVGVAVVPLHKAAVAHVGHHVAVEVKHRAEVLRHGGADGHGRHKRASLSVMRSAFSATLQ